jgi:hypothetical protein
LSFSRREYMSLRRCSLAALLSVAACAGDDLGHIQQAQAPTGPLDTPTVEVVGATQTTLTVRVCAGDAPGAQAGFSLQWMTAEQHALTGWDDETQCEGSFSGNAHLSRYDLGPNECVDLEIGALIEDPGASFTCNALECGTEYVFRAFAKNYVGPEGHFTRSDFTEDVSGSTLACEGACTFTQGYWKNHEDAWPVSSLSLGNVEYDAAALLAILRTPVAGNGLISLAHQLIAAKLNVAAGAPGDDAPVADADALIGDLVVPPSGDGHLAPADTSALVDALAAYNEGETGPGHCEDDEEESDSE